MLVWGVMCVADSNPQCMVNVLEGSTDEDVELLLALTFYKKYIWLVLRL